MFRDADTPLPSFERCRSAVAESDASFDGRFIMGVASTGIYCRPSCPARTPKAENMRFYRTPEEARAAGFRACKRCHPDAAPGWDPRSDAVASAVELIEDGVVDREGVAGLARRLGFTERHLRRMFEQELGAGPLALARRARAANAKRLLEQSELSAIEIAFAAGFESVRQFNATMRDVYGATPSELRSGA